MPDPVAFAAPQELQASLVTRPVGSPPLKILAGLTCPNPAPCANRPASRPSTGTAALDPADAGDAAGAGPAGGVAGAEAGPVAAAADVAALLGAVLPASLTGMAVAVGAGANLG